ncbi:CheY-like chemotaxis protein [Rhodopseudomonas rhenobacensis]|uniref:CheY-like chemotaxis protein n=1 Tax=Rhodopseudomonas rhenobacensis TaxID=87461 RepID=A0A7W8DZW6_9BRAD|nr:response regulator [Rhodopseudomonas rhenobacensis]MBB5048784.1 CheY-like chemotaxis protein [Rhodopseudomonas rhenobacensis]
MSKKPIVLVVEDESLLRANAVEMIEAAGFQVVEAANADEAIEILEARNDIRVVFTDIQMPGAMDGLKLAQAVRGRWPPIEIITTSGQLSISPDQLPERGRFLPKPYSPAQIAGVISELIC